MVGDDARYRVRRTSARVEALLSAGFPTRYGLSHPRLFQARVDLRALSRHRASDDVRRLAATRLWNLLSLLQDELALLVRFPALGGDVLRPVLRPGDFLSRLLAWGSASKFRVRRNLCDGCALLHDSLRKAVFGGEWGDRGGHRPPFPQSEDKQHLPRLSRAHHRRGDHGLAGLVASPRPTQDFLAARLIEVRRGHVRAPALAQRS